jgi:hypothetical protein
MKTINYILLVTLASQPLMHADDTLFSSLTGWVSRNISTIGICSAFTAINLYRSHLTDKRCRAIANEEYSNRNNIIKKEFVNSNLVQSMMYAQLKKNPDYKPKNTTTLGIMAEFTDMLINAHNEQLNVHEEKIEKLNQQIKILLPIQEEMPHSPKQEAPQKSKEVERSCTLAQNLFESDAYNNKIFGVTHAFAKKNSKALDMISLIKKSLQTKSY